MSHKGFSHIGLSTHDLDATREFYENVLGFKAVRCDIIKVKEGGRIRHENGMVLSARLDTPAYGAISLDGTLRSGGASSVVTLWQRGLAFDNGWRANNGLGMMNTPAINLARLAVRGEEPRSPFR